MEAAEMKEVSSQKVLMTPRFEHPTTWQSGHHFWKQAVFRPAMHVGDNIVSVWPERTGLLIPVIASESASWDLFRLRRCLPLSYILVSEVDVNESHGVGLLTIWIRGWPSLAGSK